MCTCTYYTCIHVHICIYATHCNTMKHTATHCNTLQHTATHCNTLQHAATRCNTMQHKLRQKCMCTYYMCIHLHICIYAAHCNTMQLTATHFNTHCNISAYALITRASTCIYVYMPHTATHCNTLLQRTMQHGYKCTYYTRIHLYTCIYAHLFTFIRDRVRHLPNSCIMPLQHTATHYNTLQHTATHCKTLQHTEHSSIMTFELFFVSRTHSTYTHTCKHMLPTLPHTHT